MTPDQARTAAEAILTPSLERQAVRKMKLQERLALRSRWLADHIPTATGAIVTIASMNFFTESNLLALLTGIAAGSLVGAFLWRRPDSKR